MMTRRFVTAISTALRLNIATPTIINAATNSAAPAYKKFVSFCNKQATPPAATISAMITGQMSTLKDALIAFRLKNGMTRKAAASDADMTVDDYVATPVDNYKFMADLEKPKTAPPAAPTATPAPTPAAVATSQPPKP